MLLFFRFFAIVLRSLVRARVGPLEESSVRFTVLPHDCDMNLHLNGGRFLSFMDISRVELLGRTRLLQKMLPLRWRPIMGGALVRYRRSILPFQRFDVRTRFLGWDEKWFYLEHIVERKGELCATGYARVVIRTGGRNVSAGEVMELMGQRIDPPVLPPIVMRWREAEDAR